MRTLILTNHLSQFGGSEIVALEAADEFRNAGCQVTIVSGYIDQPVKSELQNMGIPFLLVDEFHNRDGFDIIWSQHHLLSYLISKWGSDIISNSYIVSVSLSAFHPLEVPGAVADVADIILANSPETARKLTEFGIHPDRVKVFYNAAPNSFLRECNPSETLKKLLIISNHAPPEVLDASAILHSRNISVDHIGKPYNQARITPATIGNYDALLTIGKSVQYAILSGIPVYIYDHFGGPGWLSLNNSHDAEDFNFSGRCCNRILSGRDIADEITDGYSAALEAIQVIKDRVSSKYLLHNYVSEVLSLAKQRVQRSIPQDMSSLLRREGATCGELVNHLRLTYQQSNLIKHLEATIADMESARTSQLDEIEHKSRTLDELSDKFSALESEHTLLRDTYKTAVRSLRAEAGTMADDITRLSRALTAAQHDLDLVLKSTSWKITKPLRALKQTLSNLRGFS